MTPRASRIIALRATASFLAAVSLAACGMRTSPQQVVPNDFRAEGVRQRGPAAPAHLYVSDASARAVLRFPLTAGIPAQRPDAVIGGLQVPRGIAIGPDGRLYVIDEGAQSLLIYPPAPDGNTKPVRVLHIDHKSGLDTVAVDPLGNVYVNWTHVCTTEGFVCGYSSVYAAFDKGLHYLERLSFAGGPGGAIVRSMSIDRAQNLVEESGSQGPAIYAGAPKIGPAYGLFCGAVNPSGIVWGTGNTLYETDLGGSQPQTPQQVVVIPDYLHGRINNCPAFYTIVSATIPLNDPFAIATNGKYLYVTSAYEPKLGSGVVFVFDPAVAGSQTPVATISGSPSQLRSPKGIAVGP